MYALGIDLGTTFTAAAVWRDGRAEISSLGTRGAAIPSVVVLREDETIITGETAQRRAVSAPHRVAREFKRRLGDTTPILLAGVPYSAEALMARVLRAVVDEVAAREGGPPDVVCVSHPANWGPYKTDLLHQAVRSANLEEATFTIEPVAAAVFYARQQRMPDDAVVAVYDLGGGTFDAAVLRKSANGFAILGRPEGIERLGGIDFDAAVYAHVSRALGGALEELDDEDPTAIAAVARLKEECTQAKEALSADTDTTIPVLLPNLATEVRLTRSELETMVRPALQDTIDALRRALRSAGVAPDDLHSVLLVGGSSRMPIVSQLVGAELGRPVAVDLHPKHAVALGAALVAGGATSTPVASPPVPSQSGASEPVASKPAASEPVVVEAGASKPVASEPVTSKPVASKPAASEPVVVEAGASEPVASTPVASQPVTSKPVASEPTVSEPVKPVTRRPVSRPGSPPVPPPAPIAAPVRPLKDTQIIPAAVGFAPSRTPDPKPATTQRPSKAGSEAAPVAFWETSASRSGAAQASGAGGLGLGTPPRQGQGAGTGHGAGSGRGSDPGPGRRRVVAASAAAAVVVIAVAAAGFAALRDRNDDPAKDAATSTSSANETTAPGQTAAGQTLPADEQCTDEIKANERWVCLTSAKFKGETLTIRYKSNFAGAEPNVHGGYHLHIYGGDGVTPAAEIEGRQSMTPGEWYVEDKQPSVRRASGRDYQRTIGNAPKVCARIANSSHILVQDENGTYVTGNCVPIDRTEFTPVAKKTTSDPGGGSSSSGGSRPTPTPTPTPTSTPTPTPTPTVTPEPLVTPSALAATEG